MATNPLKYLNETIFWHLFQETIPQNLSFLKKNSVNINTIGEFSFHIKSKFWCNFTKKVFQSIDSDNIFYYKKYSTDKSEAEIIQIFIEESKKWIFSLKDVKILEDKCICFLERKQVIQNLLYQVLQTDKFCKENKSSLKLIYLEKENKIDKTISCYRADMVKNVIQNLLAFTEWIVVEQDSKNLDNLLRVEIFSVAEKGRNLQPSSKICIRCGIICDSKNKKMTNITYDDYVALRSRDMQLIAMHKYGIRINDDKILSELINKLGTAAVIVDFLEVTNSSPVSINTSGIGSSKGASFIMYNFARCETILRTYYEKYISGYYPELPLLDDIDKTVLEEEDEWQLLFNFVLYFPEVIRRSVEGIEYGKCASHLICRFLSDFASAFSIYYRKVKILTENREHLLPALFARIYLIKCIKNIFLINFKILGIDPVSYM